jgi:hypothetical protein
MITSLEEIREYIERCSAEDRRALREYLREHSPHPLESEWGIDAHTILSAIRRGSDLTRRGMRGIIAEAVFEAEVLKHVSMIGWQQQEIAGDVPFDSSIVKGETKARIQVKLQRLEAGVPKLYYPKKYQARSLYVVEVQRTRNGKRLEAGQDSTLTVQTRPYHFGEFDILAVNMHPSSGQWNDFRYCLAVNLLPRKNDASLIEILQPVAEIPDDCWSDNLPECLARYEAGARADILPERLL